MKGSPGLIPLDFRTFVLYNGIGRRIARWGRELVQQLEQAITLIQKRWGSSAIRKVRETDASPPVLSTGFRDVDLALGIDGFPKGRISELVASGTSGQATLAVKVLCQAQYLGQQAVYVDVDHTVDLDFLACCGVHFDSLVILRPFSFHHALEMTGDLIREGGAGVVFFDRIHPMLNQADISRLDRALCEWNLALNRSLCTLLFLTKTMSIDRYPIGLTLPYFTAVRLAFERQDWLYCRGQVSGCISKVTILKNKLGPSGRSVLIKAIFNNHSREDKDA